MGELAQAQVGDGDEVGCRPKAAGRALGLLHQAVHGLDEGVATMVLPLAADLDARLVQSPTRTNGTFAPAKHDSEHRQERLGFRVESFQMNGRPPFANLLLVARLPPQAELRRSPV